MMSPRFILPFVLAAFVVGAHAGADKPPGKGAENRSASPSVPDSGATSGSSHPLPADPGIVATPPPTSTEALKEPPKNIDPEIDDATGEIDQERREESHERQQQVR